MRYEINEWTKGINPKTFGEGNFYPELEMDIVYDNTTIYESEEAALKVWKECKPEYTAYGNEIVVKCYSLNKIDENDEYIDTVEISNFEDLVFEYIVHDIMWHAERLYEAMGMDVANIRNDWEHDYLTEHLVSAGDILHYFDGSKEGAINVENDKMYLDKDEIEELGIY